MPVFWNAKISFILLKAKGICIFNFYFFQITLHTPFLLFISAFYCQFFKTLLSCYDLVKSRYRTPSSNIEQGFRRCTRQFIVSVLTSVFGIHPQ